MGKDYWRSLDELADSDAYRAFVAKEFPGLEEELTAPSSRRDFFKVMGASLAMASLTACRWPRELIVPYANRPEGRIPGVPVQYASALELGGSAVGVLVSSYDGRPVKIEGNPLHPASLGAADVFMQAAVLELYDPDRSRQPVRRESGKELPQTAEDFDGWAREHFAALRARNGAGLAILAEASSSPTLAALRARLAGAMPAARWHEYEPISRDNERAGTTMLFGAPLRPVLHLEHARTIVCLDADPLGSHPAALANAREFAASRTAENGLMSRLWVAESALSITGGAADHRVALPPSAVASLAATLTGRFIKRIKSSSWGPLEALVQTLAGVGDESVAPAFVAGVLAGLERDLGRAVVVVGPRQPAEVHALAALVNLALGAVGGLVTYVADDEPGRPPHVAALRALCADLAAGTVDTLLILGGNPVYDAPADLDFAACLKRAPSSVHLSLYDNETSRGCRWHVPRAHVLESWGDARAWDGTYSVVQPLIEPLYGGRTPIEAVAALLGEDGAKGHDLVRRTFAVVAPASAGDAEWRRALHDGVLARSAPVPVEPRERFDALQASLARVAAAGGWRRGGGIEAVFVADRKVLRRPVREQRVAAGAAGPADQDHLGQRGAAVGRRPRLASVSATGDVVKVTIADTRPRDRRLRDAGPGGRHRGAARSATGAPPPARSATASGSTPTCCAPRRRRTSSAGCDRRAHRPPLPARAHPGPPRDRRGGLQGARPAGRGAGARGHARRVPEAPGVRQGDGRGAAAGAAVPRARVRRRAPVGDGDRPVRLHRLRRLLDRLPGREQHPGGRQGAGGARPRDALDPHRPLLRGDRPRTRRCAFQPMACQHCENAPCEQVCPVAATVHSERGPQRDGLQPLRRHPLLLQQLPVQGAALQLLQLHASSSTQVEKMAFNPEVTVRSRGVMEKCTYCVQRIEAAKIAAKNERRPLARRRDRAGVRADLPDAGDHLRRRHGPREPRRRRSHARAAAPTGCSAELAHRAAHALPGASSANPAPDAARRR